MKQKNNKKLKIVFLDFDDIKNPFLAAGQAKATFEVCTRLIKKGHKVTVISSKYPGFRDRTEQGIHYKHIGLASPNIKFSNLVYILALPVHVRKIKADIIVECFTAPISTLFSPLFTKIPVIALTSSFEADRFSKLYHLPFNMVENFGARFYKYALPLSEYADKKLKDKNNKVLSKIVPEGVSKEFFKIERVKSKHILFLGRFDISQKGIDLLIKAYSKVASKIKYPLVIAGHGPDQEAIEKLIRKYKMEKFISIAGPAYGAKKEKLLSEAAFVALPSKDETFSCFALEAFASGLPIVSFDIPGLGWMDPETALKAKSFDLRSYGQKLKQLSDPKLSKKMGQIARNFARKFTWEKVANNFENFFYQVISLERKAI